MCVCVYIYGGTIGIKHGQNSVVSESSWINLLVTLLDLRFSTAMTIKSAIFWDVMPK
jgi:hypothetical protein